MRNDVERGTRSGGRPRRHAADALALGIIGLVGAGVARRTWIRANQWSLRDRVVLITGGSRGLGLVLAGQCLDAGARVCICARDEAELARAARLLLPRGVVIPLVCDVTQAESVRALVAEVAARLGSIEVLINNAGVIEVGPFQTMTPEDYAAAVSTHLWGPIHTCSAVLPDMQARRQGRIVNIASIGGRVGVPHLMPYCASKFATVGFSHTLRAELSGTGVRVLTVCPGLMRTGSARHAVFKGRHRAEHAWFAIGASMPVISLDAERAASRILQACTEGRSHLTLTLAARAAEIGAGVAPGLVSEVFGVVNRLLPAPGGIGQRSAKGYESESVLAPSVLTTLGDRAARRHNETKASPEA